MNGFTYYSPTKVLFGRGCERNVAAEIRAFGGKKILLVYGGHSAEKSGLLAKVGRALEEAGLAYRSLGGVKPNPRLELAEKGVSLAVEYGADFILAVGGGSVIDTAKAIALGAANPGTNLWDFWLQKAKPEASLPVGVILTISASGSEASEAAVLTNQDTGEKRGLSNELNRPRFAFLDPELTYTLPKYQIACGIVDIMMHTLDRYFTPTEGNELTDEIAEALLRVVIRNGTKALERPDDYQAMSELMWAGSLSHNDLTGLGALKDFAVHQLGHELSAMFDVAHGASLSAVWSSWAHYCYRSKPERFARYARNVWNAAGADTEAAALEGIEKTVAYFKSLNMPIDFSGLGIGVQREETLRELADRCVFRGERKVGSFRVLDRSDVYQIYSLANH
ncbi:iron-containing alcohol dehydrogenase [Caproiciproducens sp. NJN-50]|uniref:iron-containing alcohol dehydrogenase n=1 Tax=Caproiciproducens sp. NJN-50 TaxID=2507162 RepID=UPI000FFE0770|nr:iron-containing alcohol dehydrogenase [Caproiciproducens sp. NJN-50]QAT50497.1 iron-containing alcohol dehydrogenase [Caproiciproducens sp. NJN-50]